MGILNGREGDKNLRPKGKTILNVQMFERKETRSFDTAGQYLCLYLCVFGDSMEQFAGVGVSFIPFGRH